MDNLTLENSGTLQQLQQFHQNLPHGSKKVEEEEEVPLEEPVEEVIPQAAQAPVVEETPTLSAEPFEVDGQVFASERDALKYLNQKYSQTEQDNLLLEARLEGMQQALSINNTSQAPTPQEPTEVVFDSDKYYENPAAYLAEYTRAVSEASERRWEAKQTSREQDQQAWIQFTTKYPELAQFRGDVMEMYTTHRDVALTLAKKNPEKAMDFLAMKTKEKFQKYFDAMKPTRTLANTKQGPSIGSNTNVTSTPKSSSQPKKLDFVTQLRSLKK